MYIHTRQLSAVARSSASSEYPFTRQAAYSGMVAMMPWAPEPVMLMAGSGRPSTRASMAALHSREAVFRSSLEMSCPPLAWSSQGPKVVLALASPARHKAIFRSKARRIKDSSSTGT